MTKDTGESTTRKRKAEVRNTTEVKRVKADSGGEDEQDRILLLEAEILNSKKNLNNVTKLLKILHESLKSRTQTSQFASISLCRVFCRLIATANLTKRKNISDKEAIVTAWLIERYDDYLEDLIILLSDVDSAKRVRIAPSGLSAYD